MATFGNVKAYVPERWNVTKQQQMRGHLKSDVNMITEKIQETHAPDGREFDVKLVLDNIKDVIHRATAPHPLHTVPSGTQAQLDATDDKDMLKLILAYNTINKLYYEISYNCSVGRNAYAQQTAVALFNILSNYPWDAKVVIALAAFAMIYGEFMLVAPLYQTNPLAKSVAHLKHILERANSLKPKFEELASAMLDLTRCIVDFKNLQSQDISTDDKGMVNATDHLPRTVYLTIRSIVACASIIISLIETGHDASSTQQAQQLSSLAKEVGSIHLDLNKKLALCHQNIARRRNDETYELLISMFETPRDNMTILKALIYGEGDQLPLFDSSTKSKVSIETLRSKIVLLLISDLDISQEEFLVLDQMYREAKQNPSSPESLYEVVWLPIIDKSLPWTEAKQKQFKHSQSTMPWLPVIHPSLLEPGVVKYIKNYWNFTKKPIVVVLDPQGTVVNLNALHMIRIWGSSAFPFTSSREKALWKKETWRIELLAVSIAPMIFDWITEGKCICLYGGEDLEWIRKFTTAAQEVARAANIPLEMLYVGKSNPSNKVQLNNTAIGFENPSHVLEDLTLIRFFWVRLESMWHSNVQLGNSVENDHIMQEIKMMLSFDGSDQGWAMISWGSGEMAKGKGDMMLLSMNQFEQWRHHIEEKGFLPALNDHLHELHTPHHSTSSIPEMVACVECVVLQWRNSSAAAPIKSFINNYYNYY